MKESFEALNETVFDLKNKISKVRWEENKKKLKYKLQKKKITIQNVKYVHRDEKITIYALKITVKLVLVALFEL